MTDCRLRLFVFLLVTAVGVRDGRAQATDAPAEAAGGGPNLNLTTATWGGKQFWTDELVFWDWRIQRNAFTGHYRLLDADNQRRAWGTFEVCRQTLETLKRAEQLPPLEGKVVVVLHGILRTRASMAGLGDFLQRYGNFSVLNVSYASTRFDLDNHAAALARVVQNVEPGVREIDFVAHSLGNLVIRRYLADCYHGRNGLAPDPRIRRIVMLAPPNNGARFAEVFRDQPLMKLVWGPSAQQLAEGWDELGPNLAVPRCQFGILAGGGGRPEGGNPWLRGEDDLVVSVDETKLPGAHDFAVLPVYHGLIMDDMTARAYILRFLQFGYFTAEAQRQPLPLPAADPSGP